MIALEQSYGVKSAADFATAIARLRSCEEVKLQVRAVIAPLGFTASACGGFDARGQLGEAIFYFQDWPQFWIDRYVGENFATVDFSVTEARQRWEPFTWLEALQGRTLQPAEKRLWQAANEAGWRNGLNVPIHGPGGEFGLVTFAGNDVDYSLALRQHLHLIAIAAHARCRAIAGSAAPAKPEEPLTIRELECLRLVAAGLSDPDVARRFNIAPSTAKGYLDSARRKIGARSRAQAVLQAYVRGLI